MTARGSFDASGDDRVKQTGDAEDTTEEVCAGGLVRTVRGNCPGNDNGKVEYNAK